jgi:hypothetical protein
MSNKLGNKTQLMKEKISNKYKRFVNFDCMRSLKFLSTGGERKEERKRKW